MIHGLIEVVARLLFEIFAELLGGLLVSPFDAVGKSHHPVSRSLAIFSLFGAVGCFAMSFAVSGSFITILVWIAGGLSLVYLICCLVCWS